MSSFISSCSTVSTATELIETPSHFLASQGDRPIYHLTLVTNRIYTIESTIKSESAWVLFLRRNSTEPPIVVKILRNCQDTRYSLGSRVERQRCQLEALYWNSRFTPEVYYGLAQISPFDEQEHIYLDENLINFPKSMLDPAEYSLVMREMEKKLDPSAEYGLVMRELPLVRRLDYLLDQEKNHKSSIWQFTKLLAKRVADMHTQLELIILPAPNKDGIQWGSIEQLQEKLEHNLAFIEPLLSKIPSEYFHRYSSLLYSIQEVLPQILVLPQYQWYFEKRVQKRGIRRCHGDLKSLNIWIAPNEVPCTEEREQSVWILDAIDFNPIYSHIDILSDFTSLVVDIQARLNSPSIANRFLAHYLMLTKQQDEVSKFVVAYYLVEKALVGAVLSIVYDHLPELGLAFLDVAAMRLKCLVDILHKRSHYASSPSLSTIEVRHLKEVEVAPLP